MQDSVLVRQVVSDNEAAAISELNWDGTTILRLDGDTPDTTPCAVLPEISVGLSVITQDQPPGCLGIWERVFVAGVLESREKWEGVICLSQEDTTHWIHVSADEVVSFTSFITPRLVRMLKGAETIDLQALADTQSRPEKLAARLHEAELTGNWSAITGYLIGAELAASRAYWLGQQVVIVTSDDISAAYEVAVEAQGIPAEKSGKDAVLAAGLTRWGRIAGVVA